MAVAFTNLKISNGVFKDDTKIETVTVPNGGYVEGTLLGKVTSTGNLIQSNAITYATTGATQVVTTAIGEVVHYAVASGTTGTGVVGHFYQALTVQATLELDTVAFATDTTNWLDLGAAIGSETPVAILQSDIANITGSAADIANLVYVAGTFNELGVAFGNGQTLANTYDSLDLKNIRIVSGAL